jgi:hypothetical protein
MRIFLFFIFSFCFYVPFAQTKKNVNSTSKFDNSSLKDNKILSNKDKSLLKNKQKPPINLYKIYTLQKDSTFVDTSLTIQSEYRYNLLRKDNFGLLSFSNEGQTYNTLDFGLRKKSSMPSFGYAAKHFNYLEANEINYYSVPTPLTDLYYKTVMEQGQALDAFLTVNTKPNLNFSVAYKGLRSLGKYVNFLSSSGNFRVTTSYFTKDKRYILNAHFTGQDLSNQENGGIMDVSQFESGDPNYRKRDGLVVYFKDATSLLKGNRFFIDHSFKLSKTNPNSLVFTHQFNQEYKFFVYTQPTVSTRFGTAFSNSISTKTRYNHLYNKLGVAYKTKSYGDVAFFIEDHNYNYYYDSVVYDSSGNLTVPNSISDRINTIGGNYTYFAKNITAKLLVSQAISNQSISTIEANASYKFNDALQFEFNYLKQNSLPNLNYTLYQSDYTHYNWYNNFKSEKVNQFTVTALSKWINLTAQYKVLNDYLYFDNTTNDITSLLVSPVQYDKTINYLSVKASKEIKFWKLALDNTLLYQNVDQTSAIVNVPQLTTRNTLYYTGHVFKKAMLLQTGVTLNYFTKYYANDYNPLLGEFYVQNETKIGNFPMLDFFVNARIRQTRLFLKAEHFNSALTGFNFYSAPNYPYRDFMIRFGLVWNFFK